jgi:hypothetical protein
MADEVYDGAIGIDLGELRLEAPVAVGRSWSLSIGRIF